MPPSSQKAIVFQIVAIAALGLLAACSVAEKPEGADIGSMTHIANQLRGRGDDAGAADFYQRALQRDPKDKTARKALAEIFEAHGDTENALLNYNEALRNDPNDGELHRNLGRLYIKLNRPQDAKGEYERALSLDARDTKAMNGLGISLDYLGKHEAAQKIYKEVLDEKSDDMTALNNLAHSYVLVGSYEEAIKILEPHVKSKHATPALRQNLAEAYGMAGMQADAERVARMDLTPEQMKRNLDYYNKRRNALSLTPKLYADLGSFPTQAMAEARLATIRGKFKEADGLVINVTPEVKAMNSTPSFVLRALGFARPDKVKVFCDKLKKEAIDCKPHT
ncbi:MAG: tetratricopeptide repeat protein [Alphaproteobacteria bacterium]